MFHRKTCPFLVDAIFGGVIMKYRVCSKNQVAEPHDVKRYSKKIADSNGKIYKN